MNDSRMRSLRSVLGLLRRVRSPFIKPRRLFQSSNCVATDLLLLFSSAGLSSLISANAEATCTGDVIRVVLFFIRLGEYYTPQPITQPFYRKICMTLYSVFVWQWYNPNRLTVYQNKRVLKVWGGVRGKCLVTVWQKHDLRLYIVTIGHPAIYLLAPLSTPLWD